MCNCTSQFAPRAPRMTVWNTLTLSRPRARDDEAYSLRRDIGAGGERPRPDLGDGALERDLPGIGGGGGTGLGHGTGEIGQGQHAVESRLGETIDDGVPVGETVAI